MKKKELEQRIKELEEVVKFTSGAVISLALAIQDSKYKSILDKESTSDLRNQIGGIMKWAAKKADEEAKTKPN